MKHESWDALPLWAWIGIALILLVQSTWLFVDARKGVLDILGFGDMGHPSGTDAADRVLVCGT